MSMSKEIAYTKSVPTKHIKALGQYFTHPDIADFMCSWACRGVTSFLDPAVGNSIFLTYAQKYAPQCSRTGYEIDDTILHYFGNPSDAHIIQADYLLNDWDKKYDSIVCNPPYNRFQVVSNRSEVLDAIYAHTGFKYNGCTNLYALFLLKSIYQLADSGKLAYLIPSEFLDSKYGISIKQLLIEQNLIRSIIKFENDHDLFFNATTTCCILLLDHAPKKYVSFYRLFSIDDLQAFPDNTESVRYIEYSHLNADDKWSPLFSPMSVIEYNNLKPISDYCTISRGIATGSNDFFCFSRSKAEKFNIPERCLTQCICRSSDIKTPIFRNEDFDKLSVEDKTVYLLDVTENELNILHSYIELGESNGTSKKYLTSCRNPWYSMEQKPTAPIWISSACRNQIKVIRNTTSTKALSTFHSVFVHNQYIADTDLIFCYFLTPVAQAIIKKNRKVLGNGLDKFQPNDLNTANMLDISIISPHDKNQILKIYNMLQSEPVKAHIAKLNEIFSSYLTT